ncbi:MAG: hypothetical protein IT262_07200 [Saprospiraceae bacterium]|nr:hypothetical protein [Saprospiraceae bacterium]
MVQATFTISAEDFNDEIFEKIKTYLKGQQAFVTISIQKEPSASPKKETREEYFERLDKSIAELEHGEKMVSFTVEEFEEFVKK